MSLWAEVSNSFGLDLGNGFLPFCLSIDIQMFVIMIVCDLETNLDSLHESPL
jgi:hypothetical protein